MKRLNIAPPALGPVVFLFTLMVLCAAHPVSASPAQPPDQVIQQVSTRLLDQIRKDRQSLRGNPEAMYKLANNLVLPHVDADYMSQLVLGRSWSGATPDQRQRFSAAFTHILVKTYGAALLAYEDERIQWDSAATLSGGNATVRSTVIRSSGPAIPINYSLHIKGDDWRVYDISVDAISLVTNYRSTFASEIRKNGLENLISQMEQRSRSP